jgi:cytochrome P450
VPARIANAGLLDLARLLGQLGVGRLRPGFDAQAAGCQWARALTADEGATDLRIGVAGKSVDLIASLARSDDILARPPDGPYTAGTLKTGGMSFLAPHALTIQNGEAWHRLRRVNEAVLGTGGPHAYAQSFLDHVRAAFDGPVANIADIRRRMGRAMTGIVLGTGTAESVADDVAVLFGVVQSPLKRKLFGNRYRSRRARLYEAIARSLDGAGGDEQTLVSLARREGDEIERDVLMEQVPHWMFTFTGSGADLLARTLALITSRPAVRQRAIEEIAAAGAPHVAESVERLAYVNACLLEAGRLFTPVTRTFHRATGNGQSDIVHYLPLLQRDDALGSTVHHFVPERWLAGALDAPASASNLFLRGPRACPGSDLILFVCRAALARLVAELRVTGGGARLSHDPLPLSFPEREARFTVAEATP